MLLDDIYSFPLQNKILIGVTGTDGKTSTVNYLAQCLSNKLIKKRVGIISSLGNGIYPTLKSTSYTTPPSHILYENFKDFDIKKVDIIIIECSSHGLDQGRLNGINFNTTINMLESWILGFKEPQLDSNGMFIDNKFNSNDKFKRRLTGDLSLSLGTKLYGVLSTNIFNLTAIRHVISPSVSYSYRPDFSKENIFGLNINYVKTDSSGDVYDYFSGNLVPSTPLGKRESYSFKLNNDFYGKILNNGEYKKIHLINWSNSLSYNPTYEEFQLSNLNSSIRSTLSSNLNFNINFNYDFYKMRDGSRINEIANSPRLTSLNSSVQFKLFGKQIDRFQHTILDSTDDNTNINSYSRYEPILTSNNKWQATFNLGSFFNFNNSLNQWDKDCWFDSNLDFNITKQWSLSYSARFDVMNSEIVRHNLMIYRPLHCWMFSFQ